jgi:hypothetical protein
MKECKVNAPGIFFTRRVTFGKAAAPLAQLPANAAATAAAEAGSRAGDAAACVGAPLSRVVRTLIDTLATAALISRTQQQPLQQQPPAAEPPATLHAALRRLAAALDAHEQAKAAALLKELQQDTEPCFTA